MAKWQMIRVSAGTHKRLEAYKAHLHQQYVECKLDLPDEQAEHVSYDYAIRRLLNATLRHRKRARKQR